MLAATVNFRNSRVVVNLNFLWFKLVLQSAETKGAVLALAPTVDLSILSAEETLIATTGNVVDATHWNVFNEDWRVFKSHRVIDSKLAVFIRSHRIQIVIVCHEAGVTVTAGHLPDRDVVRAKLGECVHLVTCQRDA